MGAVDGCSCASVAHGLRSPSAQRSSRRRSDFPCAAIRSTVVRWAKRSRNAIDYAKFRSRSHDAVIRVYGTARRKYCRKRLPSSMPNESKKREEYISDALDLMVKAGWAKQQL